MAKLGFCLFKYFPYGGLQRDFFRIAQQCQQLGHEIFVYALTWQGEIPDGFQVKIIPTTARQNHRKYQQFADQLPHLFLQDNIDISIGFNKLPHLNFYYAADACYQEKVANRSWLYKMSGRHRIFSQFEEAVFSEESHTEILMISQPQIVLYQIHYHTPQQRFIMLPPGIDKDRAAGHDSPQIRQQLRQEFQVADDEFLLLMVGSGFKTKGVDRSLLAVSNLVKTFNHKIRLIVIGQDKPDHFLKMAAKLNITNQVTILPGRDDVPRFLQGSDLLLHPAYNENTGTILLEAVIAGLPVLASDICGYANYIVQARAGELIRSPFNQTQFEQQIVSILNNASKRQQWRQNGIDFSKTADIYSLVSTAARRIDEKCL